MEAAATVSGPSGTWLALSGVDPDLPVWTKSVRLFRWGSGWQFVSRVATVATYTEIQDLFVSELPDGATVTWRELSRQGASAMARVGISTDSPGTPLVVDAHAQQAKPLTLANGTPAWVVQHVSEITGLADLRLVRLEGRGTTVSWRIPYPYTGYYAATPAGPNEVLVTGSEFDPDPARPTVRSLTLRLSSSCQ